MTHSFWWDMWGLALVNIVTPLIPIPGTVVIRAKAMHDMALRYGIITSFSVSVLASTVSLVVQYLGLILLALLPWKEWGRRILQQWPWLRWLSWRNWLPRLPWIGPRIYAWITRPRRPHHWRDSLPRWPWLHRAVAMLDRHLFALLIFLNLTPVYDTAFPVLAFSRRYPLGRYTAAMLIGRFFHLLPLLFGGLAMHWLWDLCLRHPTASGIIGAIVAVVVIFVLVIGQGAMSTIQDSNQ